MTEIWNGIKERQKSLISVEDLGAAGGYWCTAAAVEFTELVDQDFRSSVYTNNV